MPIWTTENKSGETFFINTTKSKIPKTYRVKNEQLYYFLSLHEMRVT